MPKIRPLALCIFRQQDHIFVAQGFDQHQDEPFYRPIGGKIEFGEYGHQTLAREILEEIGQPIRDVRYLGTLESIFEYEGEKGHEIVLIYDGTFVNDHMLNLEHTVAGNNHRKIIFVGMWKPLAFFREKQALLYPHGLLALIDATTTNNS
jgi:8-oxo-dGTP pyrophosphatase MutT (NUDIX family)